MNTQITTFLLRQLLKTWHADVQALTERTPNTLSKPPKLQSPPLIAVLASLADSPATAHKPAGKQLPCGHRVEIYSILTSANLFGDRAWGKGGLRTASLECPSGCDVRYALPVLPAPWAVDGLQARLDLIQWAWAQGKDAPDGADVRTAKMLRTLLARVGHRAREWEMTSRVPSQRRLKQALTLVEESGAVGEGVGRIQAGPRLRRGTELYCRFRPWKTVSPGYAQSKYLPPSPGQRCDCAERHKWSRGPREWASTPAEDAEERGSAEAPGENLTRTGKETEEKKKKKKKEEGKKVRFAAPIVTRIHYFEPYWRSEYRDSGRYYSKGPVTKSPDRTSRVDDEREIERLESVRGRGAGLRGGDSSRGSAGTSFGGSTRGADVERGVERLGLTGRRGGGGGVGDGKASGAGGRERNEGDARGTSGSRRDTK